jgi:hypothetical protein
MGQTLNTSTGRERDGNFRAAAVYFPDDRGGERVQLDLAFFVDRRGAGDGSRCARCRLWTMGSQPEGQGGAARLAKCAG